MRMMLGAMLAMLAGPALAQDQATRGDPAQGLALARTWCANCHVVESRPPSATADSVPGFAAIANRANITPAGLATYLAAPHGRMPNLSLSRGETADVVAYLLSLRGK
jgi:mono/diheme cytochrome c family protein